MGRLELEELGGVLPALLLARLHLLAQLLAPQTPVAQLLLQHALLLVQHCCIGAGLERERGRDRERERLRGRDRERDIKRGMRWREYDGECRGEQWDREDESEGE